MALSPNGITTVAFLSNGKFSEHRKAHDIRKYIALSEYIQHYFSVLVRVSRIVGHVDVDVAPNSPD